MSIETTSGCHDGFPKVGDLVVVEYDDEKSLVFVTRVTETHGRKSSGYGTVLADNDGAGRLGHLYEADFEAEDVVHVLPRELADSLVTNAQRLLDETYDVVKSVLQNSN